MNNPMENGYVPFSEPDGARVQSPSSGPSDVTAGNLQERDNSLIDSLSQALSMSTIGSPNTGRPNTQKRGKRSSVVNFKNCHFNNNRMLISTDGDDDANSSAQRVRVSAARGGYAEEEQRDAAAERSDPSDPVNLDGQRASPAIESQLEEEPRRNEGLTHENDELKQQLEEIREKLKTAEVELQECKSKLADESGKSDALKSMVNEMKVSYAREMISNNENDRLKAETLNYKAQVEELQKKISSVEHERDQFRVKMISIAYERETKLLSEQLKDVSRSIEDLQVEMNLFNVALALQKNGVHSHEALKHEAQTRSKFCRCNRERSLATSTNSLDTMYQSGERIVSYDDLSVDNRENNPSDNSSNGAEHRDEYDSSAKSKKSMRNFFATILHRKKTKRAALEAKLKDGVNEANAAKNYVNDYKLVEGEYLI